MSVNIRSIDGAAGGLVRHRFLRAFTASLVVLCTFGLLSLILYASFMAAFKEGALGLIILPIGAVLIGLLFFTPVVLGVGLAGAIVDLLHRRLVALVTLVPFFLAAITGPLLVFAWAGSMTGAIKDFDKSGLDGAQGALIIGFVVLASLIAFECTGQAWWQLTTSREGFMAARGWRPAPQKLFTTFRRQLGLPAFLANFGRGRVQLSIAYFLVAVLNVGLFAFLIFPIFLSETPNQTADSRMTGYICSAVLGALLLLNLLGLGRLLQRFADARATKIYQGVREWDNRAPIVFLRAFDQDRFRIALAARDPLVKLPTGVGRARTLDEIILEHASPYGPVIAIGDPRDPTPPLGAARVFVPGEGLGWQDVVKSLAAASKAVLMCPNDSQGVAWELDLLAQAEGRLRVIYLANPELSRDRLIALFRRLAPEAASLELKPKQWPVALYADPKRGWRVLTAKRLSLESYTVAFNVALQALFGQQGAPLSKPPKRASPAARR